MATVVAGIKYVFPWKKIVQSFTSSQVTLNSSLLYATLNPL